MRGHVARDVGVEHARDPAPEEVEHPRQAEQHRHREPYSPAPERPHRAQEDEPGRERDQLGGEHVERPQVGVDARHEQVVLPDEEAQERHAEHPGHGQAVAPQRLAAEHRQQLEHDPEAGQREDVDLRVAEDPEQVLEQVGAAALARDVERGLDGPVHRPHQQRGDQHRRRQHHQRRGGERRPDEDRQPRPGHPRRAHRDDRRDQVEAEQRHRQADEREEADVGVVAGRALVAERLIAGPAGLEAAEEDRRDQDHARRPSAART